MSGTYIPEIAIGANQKVKWGTLNTAVKDPRFLSFGDSYDEVNWITGREGDNIQLRRGYALLGATRRASGTVTGIGIGQFANTQIPYFSTGRSVYYYDEDTDDTIEVGTNLLPLAASGEDVNFMPYQNLAGFWMYLTSPHSSIYKIPLADPGTAVDQNSLSYRFVNARIDANRMWGVGRYGVQFSPDLSGLYISYADKATFADYADPTINEDVGTGDGVTKTFADTLAGAVNPSTVFNVLIGGAISAGVSVTAITQSGGNLTITTSAPHGITTIGTFALLAGVTSTFSPSTPNGNILTVTDVTSATVIVVTPIGPIGSGAYTSGGTLYIAEVFADDKEGVLTSNAGGAGTINYASGAESVTFVTAPTNGTTVVANYFVENATVEGIVDFSFASTSPTIGQGYQFQQGGGALAMAMAGFQNVEYVFHTLRSWVVGLPNTASADYGDASNQQYWSQIGIPYPRAQYPTGDGIIYLDNTNPAQPKFSILQIPVGSTNLTVVPAWLSKVLDLSSLTFDKAVVTRWGEYDILACQVSVNGQVQTYNTQFYIRDLASGNWNLLDYPISCLAEFLGALISGDSLSPNVFVLFSGLDDDGSAIPNHWKSAYSNFGFAGQKKVNWLEVEGLIQRDQNIEIYLSLDGGPYALVFTISGQGAYVSSASPVGVGSNTVGSTIVGGGGAITANQFTVTIPIFTDYFDNLSFELSANAVGWAQVDILRWKDIRLKARKTLPQFQAPSPTS